MATSKYDVAVVSATKLNVPPTNLGDGSSDYGTIIYSPATTWLAGNLVAGRALLVTVQTGASSSSPTGLKVGLYKGTDSSGSGVGLVTGTDTEYTTTLADDTVYQVVIGCEYFTNSAADFYSLGLSINGGGSATQYAYATAEWLEKTHQA